MPSAITTSRVLAVPLFSYTIIREFREASLLILLLLCLTDVLDGYAARKLNASSSAGAYFDAFADFLVVTAALVAFTVNGTYPFWTVLIVIAMFLQFLATSRLWGPVYDPVGKYYGGALFMMVLLTLVFQDSLVYGILFAAFILLTIVSLTSRYLFLFSRWTGSN